MYSWSGNKDDELWNYGIFETIDDCIQEAVNGYEYHSGDTIAVCTVALFEPSVDIDCMIERLEENAYEECGEAAESWYIFGRGDKNTEAWDDLQNGVNKLVLEYLEKISEKPGFFRIEDVHMVEIP